MLLLSMIVEKSLLHSESAFRARSRAKEDIAEPSRTTRKWVAVQKTGNSSLRPTYCDPRLITSCHPDRLRSSLVRRTCQSRSLYSDGALLVVPVTLAEVALSTRQALRS